MEAEHWGSVTQKPLRCPRLIPAPAPRPTSVSTLAQQDLSVYGFRCSYFPQMILCPLRDTDQPCVCVHTCACLCVLFSSPPTPPPMEKKILSRGFGKNVSRSHRDEIKPAVAEAPFWAAWEDGDRAE